MNGCRVANHSTQAAGVLPVQEATREGDPLVSRPHRWFEYLHRSRVRTAWAQCVGMALCQWQGMALRQRLASVPCSGPKARARPFSIPKQQHITTLGTHALWPMLPRGCKEVTRPEQRPLVAVCCVGPAVSHSKEQSRRCCHNESAHHLGQQRDGDEGQVWRLRAVLDAPADEQRQLDVARDLQLLHPATMAYSALLVYAYGCQPASDSARSS